MTELQRLLHIHKRIIGDLNHHMHEISTFSNETDIRNVSFRNIVFEKACLEFNAITKQLEKSSLYKQLSNFLDIRNINQRERNA